VVVSFIVLPLFVTLDLTYAAQQLPQYKRRRWGVCHNSGGVWVCLLTEAGFVPD